MPRARKTRSRGAKRVNPTEQVSTEAQKRKAKNEGEANPLPAKKSRQAGQDLMWLTTSSRSSAGPSKAKHCGETQITKIASQTAVELSSGGAEGTERIAEGRGRQVYGKTEGKKNRMSYARAGKGTKETGDLFEEEAPIEGDSVSVAESTDGGEAAGAVHKKNYRCKGNSTTIAYAKGPGSKSVGELVRGDYVCDGDMKCFAGVTPEEAARKEAVLSQFLRKSQ